MTWYAASVVTAIRLIDKSQETFPVFEDVFLIHAKSRDEAQQEAERMGHELAGLQDGLTYNDLPAERLFLGIRKLRSVYNPAPLEIDDEQPVHGTELTHSYFEVGTLEEARALGSGKRVRVEYVDDAE